MAAGNKTGNRAGGGCYLEITSVEALVAWTYHRQRAHVAGPRVSDRAMLRGGGSTATAAVGRHGRLGCAVQGSSFAALAVADSGVHADAEAVHAAVSSWRDLGASLLVLHGKALSRPDWLPEARPRWEPVKNAKGAPKCMYHPTTGKPIACLIEAVDPCDYVLASRFEWATWAAALARLHREVTAGRVPLTRWRLSRVLPPVTPWDAIGQRDDGRPVKRKG